MIILWYLKNSVIKKRIQAVMQLNKNSITEYAPEENQLALSQIGSYKEVTSKYQSLANLDLSSDIFEDPMRIPTTNQIGKAFQNCLQDHVFLRLATFSKESSILFDEFFKGNRCEFGFYPIEYNCKENSTCI